MLRWMSCLALAVALTSLNGFGIVMGIVCAGTALVGYRAWIDLSEVAAKPEAPRMTQQASAGGES